MQQQVNFIKCPSPTQEENMYQCTSPLKTFNLFQTPEKKDQFESSHAKLLFSTAESNFKNITLEFNSFHKACYSDVKQNLKNSPNQQQSSLQQQKQDPSSSLKKKSNYYGDRYIPVRNENVQKMLFEFDSSPSKNQKNQMKEGEFEQTNSMQMELESTVSTMVNLQGSMLNNNIENLQQSENQQQNNYENILKNGLLLGQAHSPQKSLLSNQYLPAVSPFNDKDGGFNSLGTCYQSPDKSQFRCLKFNKPKYQNNSQNFNQFMENYNIFDNINCGDSVGMDEAGNPSSVFYNEKRNSVSDQIIQKTALKVLHAPSLQDDFYINPLHWSSQNFITLCLNNIVYFFNPNNNKVQQLTSNEQVANNQIYYTSVSTWENTAAIGTCDGILQLWDVSSKKLLEERKHHKEGQRIGVISWLNENVFSTGSHDKCIITSDLRKKDPIQIWKNHKEEVCGLSWNQQTNQLASGGNDNKVYVWSLRDPSKYEKKIDEHKAAIKAICWSPHQSNILLSGGGNADQTIKIWNTINYIKVADINVQSQVCNLSFSKSVNQFVSTHGFNKNDNTRYDIIVWNFPNIKKHIVLEGHNQRVIYSTLSADGTHLCTGSGDETLRFWQVFPKKIQQQKISHLENITMSLR